MLPDLTRDRELISYKGTEKMVSNSFYNKSYGSPNYPKIVLCIFWKKHRVGFLWKRLVLPYSEKLADHITLIFSHNLSQEERE